MERDGPTKRSLHKKDFNLNLLQAPDLVLTPLRAEDNKLLTTYLDKHQLSNQKQLQLLLALLCLTVNPSYQNSSGLNWLEEELEVSQDYKDSSRLLMTITPRVWTFTNSRKPAETSELVLKTRMLRDYSKSLTETVVAKLTMKSS